MSGLSRETAVNQAEQEAVEAELHESGAGFHYESVRNGRDDVFGRFDESDIGHEKCAKTEGLCQARVQEGSSRSGFPSAGCFLHVAFG